MRFGVSHIFTLLLALALGIVAGCTTTQSVTTGAMAMEFKQYHTAIQLLKKEFSRATFTEDKEQKAYSIGLCYEKLNDIAGALEWYQIAHEIGKNNDILFRYALMLKRNEQYREALSILKQLVQMDRSTSAYQKEYYLTRQALVWSQNDISPFEIEALDINSAHADFAPRLSGNETLYFTSDRRESQGEDLYNWTGQKFMDIYEMDLAGQELRVTTLPFNSEAHESTPAIHPEGDWVVFCRCGSDEDQFDQYCLLYASRNFDGRWSHPEILPFQLAETNYKDPTFSSDGKWLFYSTDDSNGFGQYDLWMVPFTQQEWGEPTNLGSRINTMGNEVFPTIVYDTLFFSSNMRGGLGGLDIFYTYFDSGIGWLPPQLLPYPLNSGGDDCCYQYNLPRNEGYFSSSRMGGEGADDIYKFSRRGSLVPQIAKNPEDSAAIKLQITVKGEVYQSYQDPSSGVADAFVLPDATVRIVRNGALKSYQVNQNGQIVVPVTSGEEILLVASAPDHLRKSKRLSTFGITAAKGTVSYIREEILLPQRILNQEIVLNNIYYDFDKAEIRFDAAEVLDTLARLLIDNPDLNVEMGSHTDCRGETLYNQDLSQRRAEAAVSYLASRGVQIDRLTAKGYGELLPTVNCLCEACSEGDHQKNRRTTFLLKEASQPK